MRSEHADKFNHDGAASGYDRDVENEENPIRAGYKVMLDWVASVTNNGDRKSVLDIGSGTGNLSVLLCDFEKLTCVDVSEKMAKVATKKLVGRPVEFIKADMLEFFAHQTEKFDAVVSTYAVHHLTEPEKVKFLELVVGSLNEGGVFAFGDLMFENSAAKEALFSKYHEQGRSELVDDINDEFFWDVESAVKVLESLGRTVEVRRVSELSWGIRGK